MDDKGSLLHHPFYCPIAVLDTKKPLTESTVKGFILLINYWCRDQESNQGHTDFQSVALPTELSRHRIELLIYKTSPKVSMILSFRHPVFVNSSCF